MPPVSTLDDLVRHLDLPHQEIKLFFVNDQTQELEFKHQMRLLQN